MVLGRLISLATLGYTARVFGPRGYGLVGYGASVVAYAGVALSPGLVTWGVRAVARDRSRAGMYLVAVNATQVGLSLLAYSCLAAFAHFFVSGADEKRIVLLSGLGLFQTALAAEWVFNGMEMMRVSSFLGLLNTTLYTAGLLIFIHSPDDVFRLPVMSFCLAISVTLTGYVLLARQRDVHFQLPTLTDMREVIVSAASLSVMVALVVALHYANNFIVQAKLGTRELGVFLAAFRLVELASTVPGLVSTVVLPRLARKLVTSAHDARREAALFARVLLFIGFLGAALAFAEADGVIRFIYGSRFDGAIPLLRVMSIAILFNFAIVGYTNTLISFGRDRVMIAVVLVSATVSIGGGLLLVPRVGAMGAAIVLACIDLAGFCVSLPAYRESVGPFDVRGWLLPAGLAACTILLSVLLQRTGLPLLLRLPLAAIPFAMGAWRERRTLLR